jgi:transposase-like protein
MAETRGRFDQDFRAGAVRIVRETGKPVAQVAKDPGINKGALGAMSWPASERYALGIAPDGLAFVQDLLNTRAAGRPRRADLLSSAELADAWVGTALASWAAATGRTVGEVTIGPADVRALRALRAELHDVLAAGGEHGPGTTGTITVPTGGSGRAATLDARLGADGSVELVPRGTGWRYVYGAIVLEIHAAQQRERWRRLKICRNPHCCTAFYDRSRSNNGVWHDVRVCGNAINLRASRTRRRAVRTD